MKIYYNSKKNKFTKEITNIVKKVDLNDYILYYLKRETQIIYPQDWFLIAGLLWIQKGHNVFESWIWSWAMSLILLSYDINLYSFEKKQDFINLAKKNISIWEDYIKLKFNHQIIEADICNYDFSKYKDFFDAWFLDIKEPDLVYDNIKTIFKKWANLIIWVPTANQVEKVLKTYIDFKVYWVYTLNVNEREPIPERLRFKDWQVWSRWFIIKLYKPL